jgi:hypothetical protein
MIGRTSCSSNSARALLRTAMGARLSGTMRELATYNMRTCTYLARCSSRERRELAHIHANLHECAVFAERSAFARRYFNLHAPEGCPHGTHTSGTAYTRGTYSRVHTYTQAHTNTNALRKALTSHACKFACYRMYMLQGHSGTGTRVRARDEASSRRSSDARWEA